MENDNNFNSLHGAGRYGPRRRLRNYRKPSNSEIRDAGFEQTSPALIILRTTNAQFMNLNWNRNGINAFYDATSVFFGTVYRSGFPFTLSPCKFRFRNNDPLFFPRSRVSFLCIKGVECLRLGFPRKPETLPGCSSPRFSQNFPRQREDTHWSLQEFRVTGWNGPRDGRFRTPFKAGQSGI